MIHVLILIIVLLTSPAWADTTYNFTDASGGGTSHQDHGGPFILTAEGLALQGVVFVDSVDTHKFNVTNSDITCFFCPSEIVLNGVSLSYTRFESFPNGGFSMSNVGGFIYDPGCVGSCTTTSTVGTYSGGITVYPVATADFVPPLIITFEGTVQVTDSYQWLIGFGADIRGETVVLGPVPEPATWLLLGSGVVGMMLWRKRSV